MLVGGAKGKHCIILHVVRILWISHFKTLFKRLFPCCGLGMNYFTSFNSHKSVLARPENCRWNSLVFDDFGCKV